ncbi:MAG: RNA polymerase sigma factor [Hyphomicrobiaceae bacterium]|jgi:RNA polymerase sigma-70 factor (ECF subfamily)
MIAFLPRLRRFAYALTGDAAQGDDLAQDTCVRALQSLHLWEPGTRLESWMFRIANNLWIDRMRQQRFRGVHASIDEIAPGQEPVGSDGRDVAESRLALAQVMQAIGKLPEEQRALVAMVCINGSSYKEAAEILSVPIGTVMSRLARARKTLFETLAEAEG